MELSTFSFAICPPEGSETYRSVGGMKKLLHRGIGDYGSRNAGAHITFNNFVPSSRELPIWEAWANRFCAQYRPFEIRLNAIKDYKQGTLYLSPDLESHSQLCRLMVDFHRQAPFRVPFKSKNPHMSIARQLAPENLQKAKEFFEGKNIELSFYCEGLSLRERNPGPGQYFVTRNFLFGKGNQSSGSPYQSLLWD